MDSLGTLSLTSPKANGLAESETTPARTGCATICFEGLLPEGLEITARAAAGGLTQGALVHSPGDRCWSLLAGSLPPEMDEDAPEIRRVLLHAMILGLDVFLVQEA